jgi:hypothetical protein
VRAAIVLLTLASCGGGLPDVDVANLENAARTSAAAYRYEEAGAAHVLIFATHCSLQAVLRDQKLAPLDAGVPCP